ncbi:MAG: calcium/sodium antiporter [Pseudomonadota bacterium]
MLFSLITGLALLLVGGEFLVRGSIATAERLRVSPLIIGVTLVGFGTSAPELFTSINAALLGASDIAVGNIVGSNIANVLLVLAIGAILSPFACSPDSFKRDGPVIALSAIACTAILLSGHVNRFIGITLLIALVGYLTWTTLADRRESASNGSGGEPTQKGNLGISLLLALVGLGGIVVGADLLVVGAIDLATLMGVSQTLIGLTVVAIGTSLPELATTIVAAFKRQGDIAFGNIIGSNIFNSLGILGATAVVQPIPVPEGVLTFDVWVMLAATAALIIFAITSWRINRIEGGLLLTGYAGYLGFMTI